MSDRRADGTYHDWKIYEVEAEGEIRRSPNETKQARWFSKEEALALARRTEARFRGEISDQDWEQSPGIEPVWYEWLRELKII